MFSILTNPSNLLSDWLVFCCCRLWEIPYTFNIFNDTCFVFKANFQVFQSMQLKHLKDIGQRQRPYGRFTSPLSMLQKTILLYVLYNLFNATFLLQGFSRVFLKF